MYISWGKRLFDIFFSILGIIALAPLLVILAILIYLFDKGPIFFCQERVGKDKEIFFIFKFRTMPVNTLNLPSSEISDIKITWIGRLLRRTNFDELPQLFNILRNEMSIVGPRPPIASQKELIQLRVNNGSIKCKPGLTGIAQIYGFDGMSNEKKANFDEAYSKDLTFFCDLKVILKTFNYLLNPPPKY